MHLTVIEIFHYNQINASKKNILLGCLTGSVKLCSKVKKFIEIEKIKNNRLYNTVR